MTATVQKSLMPGGRNTKVVGVKFGNCQSLLVEYQADGGYGELALVHERNNDYDEHAMAVCWLRRDNCGSVIRRERLGYLCANQAKVVHALRQQGKFVKIVSGGVTGGTAGKPILGLNACIYSPGDSHFYTHFAKSPDNLGGKKPQRRGRPPREDLFTRPIWD